MIDKALMIGLAVDAVKFESRKLYANFQFFTILQQVIGVLCAKYERLEKYI